MQSLARDVVPKEHSDQFRTNCIGFVSLTILLWDHIATFGDEVEYVWNGTNGPIKYLFLLNRYLIPLGFSINIFAYLSPALSNLEPGSASTEVNVFYRNVATILISFFFWTMNKRCAKFIHFEGAMTVIGVNIVAIMMFYRVYVLYWAPCSTSRRRYVYILAVVLLLEFVVNAWLLTKGGPVPNSLGCEMIFVDVSQAMASSSAWLPLLFDTLAFLLIFRNGFNLNRRILEDGLLYYCPILVVTLSLSLMIAFSKPGSQNLVAQLELIITVTMMSRISINLKKSYHKKKDIDTELASMPSPVNAIVEHTRAQISSVLDITRSRAQNESGDTNIVEMVTWNRNANSSTDSDIGYGRGNTKNCVA